MPRTGNSLEKSSFGLKKRFASIRFKIVFWFVITGAVPAIAVGVYAIFEESKALTEEAIRTNDRILAQKLEMLETHLGEIEADLQDISKRFALQNLIEAIPSKDDNEIESWLGPVQQDLSRFASIRKRYSRIQLVSSDGREIIHVDFSHNESTIQPKENLKDISSQPHFKTANSLLNSEFTIAPLMAFDPLLSREDFDSPVIRYATPLFTPGGDKIAIIILTAQANEFLATFGNIDDGKMMLVDEEGYFLYHPDPQVRATWETTQKEEKIQKYYSESLFKLVSKEESGDIVDHPTEFLSYREVDYDFHSAKRAWLGIYAIDRDLVLQPATNFRNQFILILLVIVAIVFTWARVFGKKLMKPLDKVVAVAQAISNHDLTQEKLVSTSDDEIGVLAHTFNTMTDSLRANFSKISDMATTLSQSFTEISAAVQEQSSISSQQSTSVTEITATLEELSASSSQIADNSNSVVDVSSDALRQTEMGVDSIKEMKEKMDQIGKDNKQRTKEIVELGKKSQEITKVMEIINNIADQTKLIAFNAAIEASSAGEAGKRFGVVAVEIRRLADNVMHSTKDIESRIEEIQQAINSLVIASEKGASRIEEGTTLGTQTLSQLESLLNGAKSTNDSATQISLSTQQQKTATAQVLSALQEIEKGIHQSSTSIKQTASITNSLTDYSDAMKQMVDQFKFNRNK